MSNNQKKEWALFDKIRGFFFDGMIRNIPLVDPKDIKFVSASPEEMERARRLGKLYMGVDYGYGTTEAQEIIRNQE